MKRAALFLLPATVLAVSVGCSPARGYCAAAGECDDLEASFPFGLDQVGEDNDSVEVCVAQEEGNLRALRANEEEECQEVARAQELYMACVAQVFAQDEGDACDGFVFSNDNPCDDELDDLFDAFNDVSGDECSGSEE